MCDWRFETKSRIPRFVARQEGRSSPLTRRAASSLRRRASHAEAGRPPAAPSTAQPQGGAARRARGSLRTALSALALVVTHVWVVRNASSKVRRHVCVASRCRDRSSLSSWSRSSHAALSRRTRSHAARVAVRAPRCVNRVARVLPGNASTSSSCTARARAEASNTHVASRCREHHHHPPGRDCVVPRRRGARLHVARGAVRAPRCVNLVAHVPGPATRPTRRTSPRAFCATRPTPTRPRAFIEGRGSRERDGGAVLPVSYCRCSSCVPRSPRSTPTETAAGRDAKTARAPTPYKKGACRTAGLSARVVERTFN